MRRFFSDDRGNMAVEFALVAPIFVALILGVADYGTAAREKSILESAARVGLQYVLDDPTNTAGAKTAAETVAPDATVNVVTSCWCSDGATVDCSGTCATGAVRKAIEVEVTEDYALIVPWPTMTDPLPLSGRAKARVQ